MGEKTGIPYVQHTFSPWWGCAKVSPGCDHCYAEIVGKRAGVEWGQFGTRRIVAESTWRHPGVWNAKAAKSGQRPRVLVSMCDVFDEEAPALVRARFWSVVEQTRHLDWLVLTKRPSAMRRLLPEGHMRYPWPNLWLGVSAENQVTADRRIPFLLETPAARRFVSAEPLLEAVALHGISGLDWVIAGGESGALHRPLNVGWVRLLRDQCVAAGVPFFFKQYSGVRPESTPELDGRRWTETP